MKMEYQYSFKKIANKKNIVQHKSKCLKVQYFKILINYKIN